MAEVVKSYDPNHLPALNGSQVRKQWLKTLHSWPILSAILTLKTTTLKAAVAGEVLAALLSFI